MVKKNIFLVLSILWFVLIIIQSAIVISNVKFPHTNNKLMIFLVLFLLPSFMFIALYFISGMKKSGVRLLLKLGSSTMLIISTAFCLIFSAWSTAGWTHISSSAYPIYSFTDNSLNYLVVDEPVLIESEKKYFEIFPQKLPDNITDVKYRYYCSDSLFGSYWYVYFVYTAPQVIFNSEMNRIADTYQTYNLTVKKTDSSTSYVSNEKFDNGTFFTITFNAKNRSIEYINSFYVGKEDVLKGTTDFPRYNLRIDNRFLSR